MIGHVTAVALDRMTDRKVASPDHRVIGTSYPRQMSAVAPYLFTHQDRYRVRPAEGHACVRAVDEVSTVFLQTDGDRVEGERLVAEDIRKADANLVAPEIRLDDRTQSLCGCAAVAPVGEKGTRGRVGCSPSQILPARAQAPGSARPARCRRRRRLERSPSWRPSDRRSRLRPGQSQTLQ